MVVAGNPGISYLNDWTIIAATHLFGDSAYCLRLTWLRENLCSFTISRRQNSLNLSFLILDIYFAIRDHHLSLVSNADMAHPKKQSNNPYGGHEFRGVGRTMEGRTKELN